MRPSTLTKKLAHFHAILVGTGRTVVDDGKGIDPATPKGFGLTTMTERVKSLGGTCAIESARGNGTTIRIEIPVQREKTERARALELVGGMS